MLAARASIACLILTVFGSMRLLAQSPPNIVLDRSTEEYEFSEPRRGNPLQVTCRVKQQYSCRQVNERFVWLTPFLNTSELSDFNVVLDDTRRYDLGPEYINGLSDELYATMRVCRVTLPFPAAGVKASLSYQQRFRDPMDFGLIRLFDVAAIGEKTVIIHVPDWLKLRITEWNLDAYGVTHKTEPGKDETVHTYTIRNYDVPKLAAAAPGVFTHLPHLIVELHDARVGETSSAFFPDRDAQYRFLHSYIDSGAYQDAAVVSLAKSITAGLSSDSERVRALYHWVQENVRYIAFEDGVAGLKPDLSKEVIRKKYGDCKGMSSLLVALIRSLGLEAYHGWIATRTLPYNFSLHSPFAANHMIAAWVQGKNVTYLDGTAKCLAFGDIPGSIQGQEILREAASGYTVEKLPMISADYNLELERRELRLEAGIIKGRVTHTYRGLSKWALLATLRANGMTRSKEALLTYLGAGDSYRISNLSSSSIDSPDRDFVLSYDLEQPGGLSSFDGEQYLDLDNRKTDVERIDTMKRRLPVVEPYNRNHRLEITLSLPKAPAKSALPDAIRMQGADYSMDAGWEVAGNTLRYHAALRTETDVIPVSAFSRYNADFDMLRKFYKSQVVISF